MKEKVRKEDYVLAALVAAIGAHLGHRWARYIGGNWASFAQAGDNLFNAIPDNPPFVVDADEAYDVSVMLRAYAQNDAGYLDLVLGIPPEKPPVLLTEEAEEALRSGKALEFLVKRTYVQGEIPGINSPGIKRLPQGFVWEHITATGRGHFELKSAPGRVDFRFRVERGGEYLGLTALEIFLRQAIVAGNTTNLQITSLCEERHREYAMALLGGAARELYGIPVPEGVWRDVSRVAVELVKLAGLIEQAE